MSVIQAISFYKPTWSLAKANKYIKSLKIKPIKPAHETKGMIHYRLEDPSDFDRFTSEKFDKEGILLTVGHGGELSCKNCLGRREGEPLNKPVAIDSKLRLMDGMDIIADPLQQVYPLNQMDKILSHPTIPIGAQYRGNFKDQVTTKDRTDESNKDSATKSMHSIANSYMPPGSMIYEMLKPISEGGIGFPFPSSASIFSPTLSSYFTR